MITTDALSASDIAQLQELVRSQGLTREQARAEFGLDDGTMNWLANSGVNFSTGGGTMTPQAAATGLADAGAPAAPSIADWYRNVAGRDATPQEIAYHQDAVNRVGAETAYAGFVNGLTQNGEAVRNMDFAAANTPYSGQGTQDSANYVDEWARNVFGRNATPEEIAQYGTGQSTGAESLYQQWLADARTQSGQQGNNLSLVQASQIGGPGSMPPAPAPTTAPAPSPAPAGGTGGTGLYSAMSVPNAYNATATTVAPAPAIGTSRATAAPNVSGGTATSATYTAPNTTAAPAVEAGTATSGSYNATTAQGAGAVTAGQGSAGSYGATTAATAAPVTAGNATAQQASSQGYNATDATAATRGPNSTYGYTAQTGEAATWTPDRQATVSGQIADITRSGSELMTLAETQALQRANARGLASSSIAVGAGQRALYEAAMPIATQDAATFARSGEFNAANRQGMTIANMGATNEASRFTAGARNDAENLNAQLGTEVNIANAQGRNRAAEFTAGQANETSRFNAQLATDTANRNLDRHLQAGIVNAEQANKMAALNAELINRAAEFNIKTDAEMQQFNIDAALRAGIVNQEQANRMSMFNAEQQNVAAQFNIGQANEMMTRNLDRALQAGIVNQEQANKMTALQADLSARADEFNISSENEMTRFVLDQALQAGIVNQDQANKLAVFNASESNESARQAAVINADLAKTNATEANEMARFNASESNDLVQLGMDSQTRLALGNIEAEYKTLMQTNASAGALYGDAMKSMTTILTNPDMDEAAKRTAIQNLTDTLNSSLSVIGQISNIDLPELDFGDATDPQVSSPQVSLPGLYISGAGDGGTAAGGGPGAAGGPGSAGVGDGSGTAGDY